MSALDKVLQPVASKFINAFGTTIKYTSATLSSYDPASGTLNQTDKNQDMKCIIEESKRRGDSTGLTSFSKIITVAAKSFEVAPTEGDKVLLQNVTYQVGLVEAYYSGDNVATYSLGLTK